MGAEREAEGVTEVRRRACASPRRAGSQMQAGQEPGVLLAGSLAAGSGGRGALARGSAARAERLGIFSAA